MENSQVQNDLRRQFFVVLMMLGIFFVSDAFCHDDGTTHTHAWDEGLGATLDAIVEHAHIHGNECPPSDAPPPPPSGDPPTDDNPLPPPRTPDGTYKPLPLSISTIPLSPFLIS